MALALLAVGCAEDWRPRGTNATVAAQRGGSETSVAGWPGAIASSVAQRHPLAGFARLPDRGNLVVYPTKRVVRRDGAYTWHRADLSEAHALAAIADGSLRLTTPAGETLDFAYERHEEHPSGDWTWVGRLERGVAADEIVLTFGDKAAFGTIAQPGREPLRLTIRDGAAWLIETDAARVADIHNRATQPEGPDYLVPPSNASPREANTSASAPSTASASSTAAATSSSAPVIDLVLGYTPGFAAMYGGQSQAVTRLNNMVAITNEAYANSQVTGRVRLVHTLQVSYADNTGNGDALEKLTGYKSGTGWIAADPAFSALRAARDQYGADLVSLVRKFNDPENDGCGIAWMIGGGGTRVDAGDESFGYSVVSDGEDQGTDGKTYFCRHETLAHEVGHNLGSQHDRVTATEDGKVKQGAYAYSFGFKTDSTNGNFYTVMAYGDSGQTRYRVFSNPRTTFCGGRVCGVVDQADNARSHEQTMPVIAGFRATVVATGRRALTDLNRDGRSELLWRKTSELAAWFMNGSSVDGSAYVGNGGSNFRVVAAGDYNGDGAADLAWSNGNQLRIWINQGDGTFISSEPIYYGADWQPFASLDVDSDGKFDILWRNGSDIAHWLMNGAAVKATGYTGNAGVGFKVVAAGDFNADGAADLALANGNQLKIWLNSGTGLFALAGSSYYGSEWQPYASGDINGDGKSDLLWRSGSHMAYWVMNGAQAQSSAYAGDAGQGFYLVASGDYNADGAADLVFANGNQMKTWVNNGAGSFSVSSRYYGDGWQPFDPVVPSY